MKRLLSMVSLCAVVGIGCSSEKKAEPQNAEAAQPKEARTEPGTVQLTEQAARAANIQLGEITSRARGGGLQASARLVLPPNRMARLSARVAGRVEDIDAVPGQKVKAGAILAHVESPELTRARASYLSAAVKTRVAQENFEREKKLLDRGISSEREMREAEGALATARAERNAAESELHTLGLSESEVRALNADEHYSARFPLRSPIDGTVLEVSATVGQSVEPSTGLFLVGDPRELWAMLDVYESQLGQVKPGAPVELQTEAWRGETFTGRVDYVADLVDEKTRTVDVRVVVPNEDGRLKPGMFATAILRGGQEQDAGAQDSVLVAPSGAVQRMGGGQVVFVPAGPDAYRVVPVEIGRSSVDAVEITSGVTAGTRVVTRGAFILKSELSRESLGEDE